MRYVISVYTWYSVEIWEAEFDNQFDMLEWYKRIKNDIKNSDDYIYKKVVKTFVK